MKDDHHDVMAGHLPTGKEESQQDSQLSDSAMADFELVKLVQQGNKRSFDLLVIKYQSRVISIVGRFVKDPSEAQDVAQETFIKAYRAIKNFRGDSAFYTWLYRIAVNTAKNFLVAKKRRPGSHLGGDTMLDDDEQGVDHIEALHEIETPESRLIRDELKQTIDAAIASLLGEIGSKADSNMSIPAEQAGTNHDITPETYLHSRSWNAFGNADGGPDADVHTYVAPQTMTQDEFYLAGDWQLVNDERQVLRSTEGEIRIRALAGEVNLVLGLEDGAAPVKADVIVDGKAYKSFTIGLHDLYELFKGEYGTHDIVLKLHGKGVSAYAFTFGS